MIKKKYTKNSEVDPFESPKTDSIPSDGLYYNHKDVYNTKTGFSSELRESNYQLKKLGEKVNHPPHYNSGKIEAIDAIWDWKLDFIEGNVVKYVTRSKHKGDRLGDLKKARWYLDYLIDKLEKE